MSRTFLMPLLPPPSTLLIAHPRHSDKSEIETPDELVISVDFLTNGLRYHNVTLDDVIAMRRCINYDFIHLYGGDRKKYNSRVLELLRQACKVNKARVVLMNADYPDELIEFEEKLKIPERWKNENDWNFIIQKFNTFGSTMSDQYRSILQKFMRTERKLEIVGKRLQIKYNDSMYMSISMPGYVIGKDLAHKFSYNLKITDEQSVIKWEDTLNEYGLAAMFKAFQLNVKEIAFDYNAIEIQSSSIQKTKAEYLRSKSNFRSNITIAPSYIFELETGYNLMAVLHQVNWRDYLSIEDAVNFFAAYDSFFNLIKYPNKSPQRKVLVNEAKTMDIKCFNKMHSKPHSYTAAAIDGNTLIVEYNDIYDVTISRTKFNDIDFHTLTRVVNAVPSVGTIRFDHSQFRKGRNRLRAIVYELQCATQPKIVDILLTPFDFYQYDKRVHLRLILNEGRVEDFLPIKDVVNLFQAFDDLIHSSGFKKEFVIWKRNTNRPLREIQILLNQPATVQIIGNDNFHYHFPLKNGRELLETFRTVFQNCGSHIEKICILIKHWPSVDWSTEDKVTWFGHVRDVINSKCKNVNGFEVIYSGEFGILSDESDAIQFKPLPDGNHFTLGNFEDEHSSMHEIDIGRQLIEVIDVKAENGLGVTERVFDAILKLPKLRELNIYLPYTTIADWTFLQLIDSDTREKDLRELQHLRIINREQDQSSRVEDLLDNLPKIVKSRFKINRLSLCNWNLCSRLFNIDRINIRGLEFVNCTIDQNAILPRYSKLTELVFRDMEVPLWIFCNTHRIAELRLQNTPNLTNVGMELILSRIIKMKLRTIHISNCPLSDEIFYSYIYSQIGHRDIHIRDLKLPLKFHVEDLPQCSGQVMDFINGLQELSTMSFPRVQTKDNYIKIILHPFLESLYHNSNDTTANGEFVEEFFRSNWRKSYLKRKYGTVFTKLIIRIDYDYVRIIASDNFVASVGFYSQNGDKNLLKVFQYFGENMRDIKILINCHLMLPKVDEEQMVVNIIGNMIKPHCKDIQRITIYGDSTNAEYRATSGFKELQIFLESLKDHSFESIHNQLYLRDDEPLLLKELEAKRLVLTVIDFTAISEKDAVTEQTIASILKLPWLWELTISPSYKNITNWDFLSSIQCTTDEQILPRLHHLAISANKSDSSVVIAEFFQNFQKLLKSQMHISKLDLRTMNSLTARIFENCCFTPEIMNISLCTIEADVRMDQFSCFDDILAVEFENMTVAPEFLTASPEARINEFYLEFSRCSNITNEVLEAIMTNNSAIKAVAVADCRVTEDFFVNRPNISGYYVPQY